MTTYAERTGQPLEDTVSNVLKWILLAVALGSFALFAWATVLTYERAAPQPDRFVGPGGASLMTADDVVAGMAWDFVIKARSLLPSSMVRWIPGAGRAESPMAGAE